jgi:hypothetical protein
MQQDQEMDRPLRRAALNVIYSDQTSVSATSILLLSEEAKRLFQWPVPLPALYRHNYGLTRHKLLERFP